MLQFSLVDGDIWSPNLTVVELQRALEVLAGQSGVIDTNDPVFIQQAMAAMGKSLVPYRYMLPAGDWLRQSLRGNLTVTPEVRHPGMMKRQADIRKDNPGGQSQHYRF